MTSDLEWWLLPVADRELLRQHAEAVRALGAEMRRNQVDDDADVMDPGLIRSAMDWRHMASLAEARASMMEACADGPEVDGGQSQ